MTDQRTRKDHVEWCKSRAREYLRQGDLSGAVSSMLSDMTKHPETDTASLNTLGMVGLMEAASGSKHGVERFIEGFN